MARSRSRSPERKKKAKGGFKWKEKASGEAGGPDPSTTTSSSYRERSPKYDTRDSDRARARARDGDREHGRRRSRSRERRGHEDRTIGQDQDVPHGDKPEGKTTAAPAAEPAEPVPVTTAAVAAGAADKTSVAAKFGPRAAARKPTGTTTASSSGPPAAKQSQPQPPRYKAPSAAEPMIIVHVNDRLGTKAAIPCLASDPVRAFKAMVAARIGRQTHEIMIKRQGERPFKDQLTLEDYGVGNGVQLDLELDTGD